jgi:hypothetical protein
VAGKKRKRLICSAGESGVALLKFVMSGLKQFYISAVSITVGVLAISLLQHAIRSLRVDSQAYMKRGDQVEARYEAYSQRLVKYYATLHDAVKKNAPDLVGHLQPPEPIAHGYQILPPIIDDAPVQKRAHTGPVAYSWPWTDHLLDNEISEIVHSERDLRRTSTIGAIARRAILETLVQNYEQQSQRLRNIDAHIQYNRFWQAAIASDRAAFDRDTALYGALAERESIVETLRSVHARFPDWTVKLRNRGALLTQQINSATQHVDIPFFIELDIFNNDWIFHVPLFTDIEDRGYVTAVKEIIESIWQAKDDNRSYRVELHVTHISAAELYADEKKPVAGKSIDIPRHLERFPWSGAILTTGAPTTHVQDYSIILGPHPVSRQVLAHEFGHILGFRDLYVRGYEDLGADGFEVMEAVADTDDIMAATANGVVKRTHFLQLLERRLRGISRFYSPLKRASVPDTPERNKHQTLGGSRLEATK